MMNTGFNFNGKKVIITGAAGVFGSWIVNAFYEVGADLWLIDQKENTLKEQVYELTGKKDIKTSSFDLRHEQAIIEYFKDVKESWQYADILINNAGIYPSSMLMDLDTTVWDDVMNINVRAPYLMSREFSKLLINENMPGSIVNIISKSAKVPRVGAVHYAMSKASLEMMTRGLSMELAPQGIRVNAVSPGFAPGSKTSYLSDDYIEAMCNKIPLGRTSGPNDAPQSILFLCSELASFITGTSLYVDGGNSAGDFNIPVIKN